MCIAAVETLEGQPRHDNRPPAMGCLPRKFTSRSTAPEFQKSQCARTRAAKFRGRICK